MSYTLTWWEMLLIIGVSIVATWTVTRLLMQQEIKSVCTLCKERWNPHQPLQETLKDV